MEKRHLPLAPGRSGRRAKKALGIRCEGDMLLAEEKILGAFGDRVVRLPLARPQTRDECRYVPRPCPFIACRHNLWSDVDERGGIVLRIEAARTNCALDFVDDNPDGMTLDDVGKICGLTRERIRQIEEAARRKLGRFTHLHIEAA